VKGRKGIAASMPINDEAHVRIQAVENRIRGNSFETGILFDTSGNVLWEKPGEEARIRFTETEIASMSGGIISHNHPNLSPPSLEDVYILWRGNLREVRACNEFGSYVLKAPVAWKKQIHTFSDFEAEFWAIDTDVGSIYRDIAAQEGKHIMEYLDEIQEASVDEISKRYGIKFGWEDLSNG
jgi:hypothetical protein